MKSITTVPRDRFSFIVSSKKLNEILTAYFNEPSNTPLKTLIHKYKDTFKFWAHESLDDIDYSDLISVIEVLYNSQVKFEITDKKIMTPMETYGSWVILSKNASIFIQWRLEPQ